MIHQTTKIFVTMLQVKRELTIKRGGKEVSLSKMLLNADFIPTDVGKAGPELIACQVKT